MFFVRLVRLVLFYRMISSLLVSLKVFWILEIYDNGVFFDVAFLHDLVYDFFACHWSILVYNATAMTSATVPGW